MKYERFSQLWDALVTNRPTPVPATPIRNGMKLLTAKALIEYGQGNKAMVNDVRRKLGRVISN